MCGICGKLNFNKDEAIDQLLIRKMTSVLAHRGPDDEGVYIKGNVGLGHRRLSIIDLSPLGHQPMSNEDESIWITFNGEIYNFPELKEELIKSGHIFRSKCDTEVIIHLYEEHSFDCVQFLRGMFAFAIWDERNQLLFLARDRLGKKPLFYSTTNHSIIFGSEIKSILQDSSIKREPNIIAIHHYLTYQYVPSPYTAFVGINKLPPAHILICRNGKIELKRYWKLSYKNQLKVNSKKDIDDLKYEIIERLKEATRIRLISDVPLGVFLSGGVDSSAITALMAQINSNKIKTFSIGFGEKIYNELEFAKIVANKFHTEHHEFIVKPNAVEILPKLIWHYDEPFADSSAIPSYYVAKVAREHITVALNGDAGDENFAGYLRYKAHALARYYEIIPSFIREKIIKSLIEKIPLNSTLKIWRLKRFIYVMSERPQIRNLIWHSYFTNEMKEELYSDDFKEKTKDYDSAELMLNAYSESDAEDFISATLNTDIEMYLPDDLLVKMDIATMANSLEARSPFLDHKFVEFSARIPSHLKLNGLNTKFILKKAFEPILPKEILYREKKGFAVPIDYWLRNELCELLSDTLLSSKADSRGYFKRTFIERMISEHKAGKWNWHYQLWALLILELWNRMFIDSNL